MKNLAYMVFMDVWRLTGRYHFQKLNDERWADFVADAEKLMNRYRNTQAESLFRNLFIAVQTFYESLRKS